MARNHGFRVYTVEAFPNRIKDRNPVRVDVSSTARTEILELLERLKAFGTVRFEPKIDPGTGLANKPVATATIGNVVEVNPAVVHIALSTGERGSHKHAVTDDQSNPIIPLGETSPEVDYMLTLVFPQTKGSVFFVVAQTVYRRDAIYRLLRMVAGESYKRRLEREDAQKEERALLPRGQRPAKTEFKKLVFKWSQASDDQYLDEILTGAESASVVFKSRRMSDRGADETVDRVLEVKLRNQNILEVGRELGRKWTRRSRSGDEVSQREGVNEAAELLVERDLFADDEGARYEEAAIRVKGKGDSGATSIAVGALRDAFTYPVSDIVPDPYSHYDKVSDRLVKVARQLSIDVARIDPHEVNRCLTDSILAPSSTE